MRKLGVVMLAVAILVVLAAPGVSDVAAQAATGTGSAAFTKTETISRPYVDNGVAGVDTRTVTLRVGQTTNLQGRQEIAVSWSGAHPTGGVVADDNSDAAQQEEYPFVLLECRGVDSASANAADRLSPESCWTAEWDERFQSSFSESYPPYQLDRYASTPGAPSVGEPSPLPSACAIDGLGITPVQYWVPWVAANGTVYEGGAQSCGGGPPESITTGGTGLAVPSNETFGVTGLSGAGSADFDVLTSDENATLGCSQTVACSLVAVPIMGIDCDTSIAAATPTELAQCEETGAYQPGAGANTQDPQNELTVSGSLWWSPSNWRNRITVPLTFAPPVNACSLVSSNNSVNVYGSELMIQATGQWAPDFCTRSSNRFSFVHVQTIGEPTARNLVATGGAEAAFTSYAQPKGYGKPVVNAPVAVTGFSISFSIDGANGEPISTLKLTPLLLAKLLTESYPNISANQGGDPALAQNPLNITDDPEFIALNPGITQLGPGFAAASELISLSSDSDVMEALTTYINDDPAARSFLDGTPDTSMPGEDMVVNPAYKGIHLPVDQWPLLSTYESTVFDNSNAANNCLQDAPVPYSSLVSAPLILLEDISESMQFDEPNSTTTCSPNDPAAVNSMVAGGPQRPGNYFMIGITPLADNSRDFVQSAQLQTASGTFVAPSNTSMEAATSLLKPDASTNTWPVPYNELETKAGASAYPGTMVVYAAVPTSGLPKADAQDYASLLTFAATTGQTPGNGVGQLPGGYLPLTKADGLGELADYTLAAAKDVAAQNGQVPSVLDFMGTSQSRSPSRTTTGQSSNPFLDGTDGAYGPGSAGLYGGPGSSAGSKAGRGRGSARIISSVLPSARTIDIALWLEGFLVVLVLALALVGVAGVPLLFLVGRRRGRW